VWGVWENEPPTVRLKGGGWGGGGGGGEGGSCCVVSVWVFFLSACVLWCRLW